MARSRRTSGKPRRNDPEPLSAQPGHSWEFFYERLTEKEFQRLCGSLLHAEDKNVRLYPVGMPDGGRDATSGRRDGQRLIYQVKWTKHRERNPVAWLTEAIRGERAAIERLVREKGARKYVLMTCVAGTSVYGTGGKDLLDAELDEWERELGIEMEVLWQDDIDVRVRNADPEVKWAFPQMLAGLEAMRYLLENQAARGRAAKVRSALLQVLKVQGAEDARVKFKQVELDSTDLAALFVDVEVKQVSVPTPGGASQSPRQDAPQDGLKHLLEPKNPFTLVRGEPGQGKSTLGQYLCQVHRTAILGADTSTVMAAPASGLDAIRLPMRLELRHYAMWLAGVDPFDGFADESDQGSVRRTGATRSLEHFLCDYIAYYSGGNVFTVDEVQDLLDRVPCLILLDGLDEIGDDHVRKEVCERIETFCQRRNMADSLRTQVVVTARPSFSSQAEPLDTLFEYVRLLPLNVPLQRAYVDKWGEMKGMSRRERGKLKRLFDARTAEGYIAQLSANPMYLTILLYLLEKNAEAVPSGRTALYREYLNALLAREVVREQITGDEEHLDRIREVISWLGWLVQSSVESDPTAGRMKPTAIRASIYGYLDSVEGPVDLVSQLFKDSSDRFWVLTSKEGDLFEFAIQPVREYFAASYLANFASLERGVPKAEVLRHLVERPYWLNTALFFGGFANPNEVSGLVDGMSEALARTSRPRHVRVAHWALLGDGVYRGYAPAQTRAVELLMDDLSLRLIDPRNAPDQFPSLPLRHGGQALADRLRQRITEGFRTEGATVAQVARARLFSSVAADQTALTDWLTEQMGIRKDKGAELLTLRAALERPQVTGDLAHGLELSDGQSLRAAMAAGVSPRVHTDVAQRLREGVLRGWASDTPARGTSEGADVLRVFRPQRFITAARGEALIMTAHLQSPDRAPGDVLGVLNNLGRRDGRFQNVLSTGLLHQTGDVSLGEWALMAGRLGDITGPCWLVTEIALMGVGSAHLGSRGYTGSDPCLGRGMNYSAYVQQMRVRHDESWWRGQLGACNDDASRMAWCAGLLCVADSLTVKSLLPELTRVLAVLTEDDYWAMAQGLSRLRVTGLVRRLLEGKSPRQNARLLMGDIRAVADEPRTLALFSLFAVPTDKQDSLKMLSLDQLRSISNLGAASWPAHRALSERLVESGSIETLNDLAIAGPAAVVEVPSEKPSDLIAEVVDALLHDPFRYPFAWVLAAERWKSEASEPGVLRDIAEEQGWVTSV